MDNQNSGPSSVIDGKISEDLSTAKLKSTSPKKPKRKLRISVPSTKRRRSYKNAKRQSEGLPKAEKKYITYEYQMKSRRTWEYADIYHDISSWHDSLKADDADVQPIETKSHHASEKAIDDVPFGKSLIENMSRRFDQQNKNAFPIDDEANVIQGLPTTFNGIVTKGSAPLNSIIRQNEPLGNLSAADETPSGPSDDKFDRETIVSIKKGSIAAPDKTTIAVASGAKEKSFKCRYCHKEFTSHCNLKAHIQIHSEEKPYKCTECTKMFSRRYDLKNHQRIHSGEKPYKCTECPKMFSQSGNLTIHQRIHSGEKPYRCTECLKMFSHSGDLKRHQGIHSGEKPYKCTACPKMFSHSGDLKRHQRIHSGEKPYKCTDCPKMFSHSGDLKRHQRIHSGEKPYKCTECPKMFSHSGNLKRHERIHADEKPYKCSECHKMFSSSCNLIAHQWIHSDEKPYNCSECPKMFSLSCNLTAHQRIDSGEKPFKFSECQKMVSSSCNLKKHQHMHSGKKPYKCIDRPKMFSNGGSLTIHNPFQEDRRRLVRDLPNADVLTVCPINKTPLCLLREEA